MKEPPKIVEYRDAGCTFRYCRSTRILHVVGSSVDARPVIIRLIREGWLAKDMRAIWFSGDPVILLVGPHLTIYVTARPKPVVKPAPTFTDIVKTL